MDKQTSVRIPPAIGCLVLCAFLVTHAVAGFIAMPLKADLDLAQTVVVGKITDIARKMGQRDGKLVWGRATVAVSDVLKGGKTKKMKMTVAMRVDREYGAQSPPRVYSVGDEGIWVIMPDGRPSHGYGLLDKKRVEEVKSALADLDKRVWSEVVTGLKVWAGAAKHDWNPRNPQQVVFAVKNISKSTLWLPRPMYQGAITAIARDSSGKEFELRGGGPRHSPEGRAVCRPLEPGKTKYMHPYGENYGFIVIPRDLPPGKYTVTVTLANTRDGNKAGGESKPVDAWKGKVAAPPFALEIPKPPVSRPTERR